MVNVELDKVKTASTVNDFLNNELLDYLANAGMHRTDISSPQLNATGSNHSSSNSAEEKMLKIFDYQNKCWAIGSTINNCSETSRKILKASVINATSDIQQISALNYSDRTFYRKKQEALCEFAQRLQYWAYRYDTNISDLRIFKKEKVQRVKNI